MFMMVLSSARRRERPTSRTFPSRVCTSKARRVAPVALRISAACFFTSSSNRSYRRREASSPAAARAAQYRSKRDLRSPRPEAFYGAAGAEASPEGAGAGRSTGRDARSRPDRAAALLLARTEPLLPELGEGREAALERLKPESLGDLLDGRRCRRGGAPAPRSFGREAGAPSRRPRRSARSPA